MLMRPEATKCIKHNQVCTTFCGWCSRPICEECVSRAGNRKYCDKCYAKKASAEPAGSALTGQAPRSTIKNTDPSLSEEFVKAQRAMHEDPGKRKMMNKFP